MGTRKGRVQRSGQGSDQAVGVSLLRLGLAGPNDRDLKPLAAEHLQRTFVDERPRTNSRSVSQAGTG